jgi:hypothetical protein
MIKQSSRRKYCKCYAKEWHRSEWARLLATLVRCVTVSLFDRVFRSPDVSDVPYRRVLTLSVVLEWLDACEFPQEETKCAFS